MLQGSAIRLLQRTFPLTVALPAEHTRGMRRLLMARGAHWSRGNSIMSRDKMSAQLLAQISQRAFANFPSRSSDAGFGSTKT